MALFKRLKQMMRDDRGNVLVIAAVTMPLLIGGAGMALDTVQISLAKRQLQRAADSAALAGVHSVLQTGPNAAAPAVTRDLQVNNDVTITGTPVVGMPTTGTQANNPRAVRVQLSTTRSLSFFSFFGVQAPVITVEATAAPVIDGTFCMLSLEDGTTAGVTVGGNAEINIGCGISTNSRATNAIIAGGNSRVTANPIMAVGGLASGDTNFAAGTQFIPYAAVQSDPFATLPTPAPTNCVSAPQGKNKEVVDLTPSTPGYNATEGSFCFNGWEVRNSFRFTGFSKPTIVYINGGDLGLGAQSSITGTEIAFVLTSTNATSNPTSIATMTMNAGAELNLTAPTSGPYAGVAFYEDRRAPLGRTMRFNGGADATVTGAMYFPQTYFEYMGNAGMAATCLQLVARRLDFRGTGTIANNCTTGGQYRNFQATFVRLVA